jgi:hypothetical protein
LAGRPLYSCYLPFLFRADIHSLSSAAASLQLIRKASSALDQYTDDEQDNAILLAKEGKLFLSFG